MGERQEPARHYYEHARGRWSGVMSARVTDVRALLRAMGVLNAMSAMTLAWWPRWLGRFLVETTVSFAPGEAVKHTTTILWCGFHLLTSTEFVTLDDDGRRFTVEGESRNRLLPWRSLAMQGAGEVDESGTRASYRITWMGTHMQQETQCTEDGILLRQNAPGFASEEHLIKVPGAPQSTRQ